MLSKRDTSPYMMYKLFLVSVFWYSQWDELLAFLKTPIPFFFFFVRMKFIYLSPCYILLVLILQVYHCHIVVQNYQRGFIGGGQKWQREELTLDQTDNQRQEKSPFQSHLVPRELELWDQWWVLNITWKFYSELLLYIILKKGIVLKNQEKIIPRNFYTL